jgi:hypothetical protein
MLKLRDQAGRRGGLPRAQGEGGDAVTFPLALLLGHRWLTGTAAAGATGPHASRDWAHAGG